MAKNNCVCSICGQQMDLIVLSHKNKPFVDGNCYPKICFGCFQVPKQFIDSYDQEGFLTSQEGPFYSYKVLHSPQELVDIGSADNLKQAKICVRAVKEAIKKSDLSKLKKTQLKKPQPDFELND